MDVGGDGGEIDGEEEREEKKQEEEEEQEDDEEERRQGSSGLHLSLFLQLPRRQEHRSPHASCR